LNAAASEYFLSREDWCYRLGQNLALANALPDDCPLIKKALIARASENLKMASKAK
jgi:hypothetical protein